MINSHSPKRIPVMPALMSETNAHPKRQSQPAKMSGAGAFDRAPLESVAPTKGIGMFDRDPIDSVPQTNDSRHHDLHAINNYQDDGYLIAEEGFDEDFIASTIASPLTAAKHLTERRAELEMTGKTL